MTTPARDNLRLEMLAVGTSAREAARFLRETATGTKNTALREISAALRAQANEILSANADDIAAANLSGALRDRLQLDRKRVEAMAGGVDAIAALDDPVGRELARWQRPNGLDIARVATPIGVIGIVYESRPNVTADAAALCLKSGNAVILRGGSESLRTSKAIHAAVQAGLRKAGLPKACVQLVTTTDRAAVGLMLEGLNGRLDLIIPRGGKSLVKRVQDEARIPVLAHLEGICHVYVHASADLEKARAIVLNSKMRRTGVCGAAETILFDSNFPSAGRKQIVEDLLAAGCEVRGDKTICAETPAAKPANEEDWRTEYLDAIVSAKVVDDLKAAVHHIETYGSHHTEAVVTEDAQAAERFLSALDSAILLWNASTQFADGGEFGMGAEIGIGTGKLHARGPVGVEQLTTFKYVVRGKGQIRP